MTNKNTLIQDIHYLNLSYLLLIQRLACDSFPDAEYLSGMEKEMIETFQSLTLPQLVSLAESGHFLVRPAEEVISTLSFAAFSSQENGLNLPLTPDRQL